MAVTLTVEDGTGLVNANTYVSAADAAAYHVEMGNASWAAAASDDVRGAALVQATRYLDKHYLPRWKGYRRSATQALEWPRTDAVDELGNSLSGVPADVVRAVEELALRALSASLQPDQDRGGQVQSLSLGNGAVALTYASGAPAGTVYGQVDDILQRVLEPGGSGVRLVRG